MSRGYDEDDLYDYYDDDDGYDDYGDDGRPAPAPKVAPKAAPVKPPVKKAPVPKPAAKTTASPAGKSSPASGTSEKAAAVSGSVKATPKASSGPATASPIAGASSMSKEQALGSLPTDKKLKPSIHMIVVGHVDAGKSTLVGHFLHMLGSVSDNTLRKHQRESASAGKGSFAYAWAMDENTEERARGVTMDVAGQHFETEDRHVVLIDAPGHRDL
jgi:elongation factor 1 alpha-like protein